MHEKVLSDSGPKFLQSPLIMSYEPERTHFTHPKTEDLETGEVECGMRLVYLCTEEFDLKISEKEHGMS